jgi:membrane protein implicated in regulation of membrane protease activity
MTNQIIALAILVFTAAIGIWKFVGRIKSEKRKLLDEADKMHDEALEARDPSRITASHDRINRI